MTRIAVLSDIHANYQALEAVLTDCEARAVDTYWYLGDIVVYGPQPNQCIERLRELLSSEPIRVRGNNDHIVIRRIKESETSSGALNLPDDSPRELAAERELYVLATDASTIWTTRQLTQDNRDWLIGLPNNAITPFGYADVLLVHASPCESVGEEGNYLHDTQDAEEAWLSLPDHKKLCFFGHTHHRTVFRRANTSRKYMVTERVDVKNEPLAMDDRVLLVNPGSVGQPRDGDATAAYAIYDTERRHIEFYRVAYPIGETIKALENMHEGLVEVIHEMKKKDNTIDMETAPQKVIETLSQRLREAQ